MQNKEKFNYDILDKVANSGGVVLGALLLGIVNNGMNLLNIPSYVQTMVQGGIILGAITIDSIKRDKKEK